MTRRFDTWIDLFLSGSSYRPQEQGFCVLAEGKPAAGIDRAELVDRALRVSGGLRDLGLGKGDVVVLVGEPSAAWVVTFAAVLLSGGLPALINAGSTRSELERVMRTSQARLAVVSASSDAFAGAHDTGLPTVISFEQANTTGPSIEAMYSLEAVAPVACSADDSAVVLQTSGTTGDPKLVVHTHRSHLEFVDRWTKLTMNSGDRALSFLPLNHQGGLLLSWISAFTLGVPYYQLQKFSVSAFWHAVRTCDITWAAIIDPIPTYLLQAPPAEFDRNHHLRVVMGSRRANQVAELQRRFGIRLLRGYGSTETTIVAFSTDPDRSATRALTPEQVAACAGPPLPDYAFRILDENHAQVAASVVGALEVRGPGIFSHYLNNPEATSQAFSADGWFKTGDRAYVNEFDELFFVERAGNAIRRSGEFISAAEVEAALLEHPGVYEACVVGVPDALRGQEVRACIVRKNGSTVTADELFDHCLTLLTKFKVPRYIDFWDEFPRTSTLKISLSELTSDASTWTDRFE